VGDVFEFVGCVIDGIIGTKLTQQFLVLRRRRCYDIGAFSLCKLHSEMADAAGPAVNENTLSRLELSEIDQ
jgi:hypothetical protein